MNLDKLGHGKNHPAEIYAVVEVAMNSEPVKYEYNKEVGAIFVDRFMSTSMTYPCNYGFMPNTLAGDGDPVDILVYSHHKIVPGAIISVRPIGVLITEDENGKDEKILAVPTTKVDPTFESIKSHEDLPKILLDRINHFFEHYKDLEKQKWVKVLGWKGVQEAHEIITTAIAAYK